MARGGAQTSAADLSVFLLQPTSLLSEGRGIQGRGIAWPPDDNRSRTEIGDDFGMRLQNALSVSVSHRPVPTQNVGLPRCGYAEPPHGVAGSPANPWIGNGRRLTIDTRVERCHGDGLFA
jgi:hypothetical protein